MADKTSFIVYGEIEETLDELTDEQVAKLFRGMVHYANTGEDPGFKGILKVAFIPIKQRMDRNDTKWAETKAKRAEAGRRGGLKSGITRSKTKQNEANEANEANASGFEANEANEAVSVSVSVPVSVSVSDSVSVADRLAAETTSSVLDYLNQKTGSRYEPTDTSTEQVRYLLSNGFTEDDIRTVIDKKCREWIQNDKMRPYLRPSTLFGDKFEEYLNAPDNSQSAEEREAAERKARHLKAKEEQRRREEEIEARYAEEFRKKFEEQAARVVKAV